ncbi:MAG: exodeoxyribonuclease V subunit alpha [Moraxella sp.]|uniref:exodeoxyribonuclease V subunit alpha n=1 Tax=Moraxella sp. TaxID=479 RepID=UPI0026DCA639|nr:exodeoxyribonuclease V subunit alpha [Moraxella sp.]MDO4449855.1 exodeoxyribonuclease V subunit alpha [Moraxella sp.]
MNHISHYLNNRLSSHASWYMDKGYIDDVKIYHSWSVVFSLVYFTSSRLLDDGHTVLVLSDNKQNDGHGYKQLKNWQLPLFLPIIEEIIDKTGFLDFDEIFMQMNEINDESSFADFISQKKDFVSTCYKNQCENHKGLRLKKDLESISNMFLLILRAYYVINIKNNGCLAGFVDELCHNPYFSKHDDELVDKVIVFWYKKSKNSMYFWLNRSFMAEKQLLSSVFDIHHSTIPKILLPKLNSLLNSNQKKAIEHIANHAFSIITGGPGTGKTFTIAQIVLALYQSLGVDNKELNLALVAPTGKASQRMAESLQMALDLSGENIDLPKPMTIHRLLGIGMHNTPKYHIANPLPYDLVVVDEASMLGTELACQLLSAIKHGARVILLGDSNQLSAVDAGAVLSDLCALPQLSSARIHLTESRRFDESSGVGKLSKLINDKQHISENIMMAMMSNHDDLAFFDVGNLKNKLKNSSLVSFYKKLACDYQEKHGLFAMTNSLKNKFYQYDDFQKNNTIIRLHEVFNKYRILTASHVGVCGDDSINQAIEIMHKESLNLKVNKSKWYHGRPVMVLKNRYDLGLFNGDIGICLKSGIRDSELSVYFVGEGQTIRSFSVSVFNDDMVSTAYAMTIHKSQGSEFDKVAIVFNEDNERLLSKELIYTAVTRAKKQVAIYSNEQALLTAINTPTKRQTGLLIHEA